VHVPDAAPVLAPDEVGDAGVPCAAPALVAGLNVTGFDLECGAATPAARSRVEVVAGPFFWVSVPTAMAARPTSVSSTAAVGNRRRWCLPEGIFSRGGVGHSRGVRLPGGEIHGIGRISWSVMNCSLDPVIALRQNAPRPQ
jgi:hypothetical protein